MYVINQYSVNNDMAVRIVVYPSSGSLSDNYSFEIDNEGVLTVKKGTRYNDDIAKNKYITGDSDFVYEEEKVKLLDEECKKTTDLVEEVFDKCSICDDVVYDTWGIEILYKGQIFKHNNYHNAGNEVEELINYVSELSPIKIDLHSFA